MCSLHFYETSLDRRFQKVRLKDGSIPSKFPTLPSDMSETEISQQLKTICISSDEGAVGGSSPLSLEEVYYIKNPESSPSEKMPNSPFEMVAESTRVSDSFDASNMADSSISFQTSMCGAENISSSISSFVMDTTTSMNVSTIEIESFKKSVQIENLKAKLKKKAMLNKRLTVRNIR